MKRKAACGNHLYRTDVGPKHAAWFVCTKCGDKATAESLSRKAVHPGEGGGNA